MTTVQRIGLFGGAFDPPHRAHHQVASAALSQLSLDRLYIVPTGQAWHKARPLTDSVHRLAMCELAFGDLSRARVDTRELERDKPSYTLDTLTELQAQTPGAQWFLILGADQLLSFKSWHSYSRILKMVKLAVAPRSLNPGEPSLDLSAVDIAYTPLQMPVDALSATEIRQQNTTLNGAQAPNSVHPEVARYIAQHHLYSKSPT
jgi:nicotinate-nucleotide adenylyltransferase